MLVQRNLNLYFVKLLIWLRVLISMYFLPTAWFDINPEKNYNVYVSGMKQIFMI